MLPLPDNESKDQATIVMVNDLLWQPDDVGAEHILVERFSVFGVQVQYWMPLTALIVAVAVAIGVRR